MLRKITLVILTSILMACGAAAPVPSTQDMTNITATDFAIQVRKASALNLDAILTYGDKASEHDGYTVFEDSFCTNTKINSAREVRNQFSMLCQSKGAKLTGRYCTDSTGSVLFISDIRSLRTQGCDGKARIFVAEPTGNGKGFYQLVNQLKQEDQKRALIKEKQNEQKKALAQQRQEEFDSRLANFYNSRLPSRIGERICSMDNRLGYLEQVNGGKVKVTLVGQSAQGRYMKHGVWRASTGEYAVFNPSVVRIHFAKTNRIFWDDLSKWRVCERFDF